MKKLGAFLRHRVVLTGLGIALQLAVLVLMTARFSQYFIPFYWAMVILSTAAVLWLISSPANNGYKIAWIVLILSFPVFGGVIYLVSQGNRFTPGIRRRLEEMEWTMDQTLRPDRQSRRVTEELGALAGGQARYLEEYGYCPAYPDTRCTYYPLGDDCLEPMLEALRNAKRYIFLEYFIITQGAFWDAVADVLEEKAKQGVDVRVIYDDLGCVALPDKYDQQLAQRGIQCLVFNRFVPVVSALMNNRDHRKICCVDGVVAFTGGINLADEYINQKVRFGHWKDSAVRLEGPGCWSLAVMFLSMWGFITNESVDPDPFRPADVPRFPDSGWVQPYTDCPWNDERVALTVYLNLINRAQRYLYIMTPYLVVDETVNTALISAAKAGVDVRIMTPHIPDKKTVFFLTRAHYEFLIRGGVKIYEYTPGFLHAKSFAVDDRFATVGSVNLDYRSLFLHFENGALLLDSPAVKDVKEDFLKTLEQCRPYTLADCQKVRWPVRVLRGLLRIFSPLV